MADTSNAGQEIVSEIADQLTATPLYEGENKLISQLQEEMLQLKKKLLIEQKNSDYWREKSLKLQIDLGWANYELQEFQGTRKSKDYKKLEDKIGKEKEII